MRSSTDWCATGWGAGVRSTTSRASASALWTSSSVSAGIGRSGAMFDGEGYAIIAIAPEIEVGVAPGVELG